MNYSIGDFIIRVKNAYMARKKELKTPYSGVLYSIAKILKEEGYIKNVTKVEKEKDKTLKLELLYKDRKPVFSNAVIISKPSVHIYAGKSEIPKSRGGYGITIISTSRGIMTDKKARKENVGGEIICQIY